MIDWLIDGWELSDLCFKTPSVEGWVNVPMSKKQVITTLTKLKEYGVVVDFRLADEKDDKYDSEIIVDMAKLILAYNNVVLPILKSPLGNVLRVNLSLSN